MRREGEGVDLWISAERRPANGRLKHARTYPVWGCTGACLSSIFRSGPRSHKNFGFLRLGGAEAASRRHWPLHELFDPREEAVRHNCYIVLGKSLSLLPFLA